MFGFPEKNLRIQLNKLRFSFIILAFFSVTTFAQELVALRNNRLQQPTNSPIKQNKNGSTLDTLDLPFVDDFSTSNLVVNDLMYEDSGGVFVNNTMCIAPPSFNTITFDGLNFEGQPYSESNEFKRGICDTLLSAPIDVKNKSNVFFSFWWQAQGNAVPQVSADSIQLLFLDSLGNWNQVWYETGQPQNDFQFVSISLDSSNYLHSGFKFKFESFGNQSGMFGVWNIDYIYLDDDRSVNDNSINDISFSTRPSSFLRKYWAMPKWHFFNNPSTEINTSVTSTLNCFKVDNTGLDFIIETNADCIDSSNQSSINIHFNGANSIGQGELQKELEGTGLNSSFINNDENYLAIENKFKVVSNDQEIGDTVNGQIADFNTTQNDSISSFTLLADYYAYDDGTAEQAFRITSQDGLVVQEYQTSQSDTLYGMSIYFPGNTFQYDSAQIILMVWDSVAAGDNYNSDNILYDERVLISVADSVNGFAQYNFFEPVVVDEKFYIGYRQDTDDDILIGYDINSNPGFEPIYFNTDGTTWQRFQLNEGVLMIRPHFKKIQIANIDKKIKELEVSIYPNPANEVLNFSIEVDSYSIFDLNGRKVQNQFDNTSNTDISNLDNGMYFILIEKDGLIKRTKFIKH